MKYMVTVNGKNYEVEVEKGKATVLNTSEACAAPAAVTEAQSAPAAPAAPAPAAPAAPSNTEGKVLSSPMPGVILDIKKSAGDPVKRGETILILEAMKMENEIAATKDGIITQVMTVNGATVNTGDPLVVIL